MRMRQPHVVTLHLAHSTLPGNSKTEETKRGGGVVTSGGTPELLTERKETFNKVSFLSSVDSGVPPSCLLEFDGTTWEAESVLDSDNLDRIRPALHPEVESEVIPILRYCPNNPKGKNKQTTYKR